MVAKLVNHVIENCFKICYNEEEMKPKLSASLRDRSCDSGLNRIKIQSEGIHVANLLQIFDTAIREGLSGCMGARYKTSEVSKIFIQSNAIFSYGFGTSTHLPRANMNFDETIPLRKSLTTHCDVETGCTIEVDLKEKKQKNANQVSIFPRENSIKL